MSQPLHTTSLYPKWILFNISTVTDDQFIPKLDFVQRLNLYRRPVYTQTGFCLASQPLQTTSLYPNWILFSVSTITDDQFIPKLDLLCSVTEYQELNTCKTKQQTLSTQTKVYPPHRQQTDIIVKDRQTNILQKKGTSNVSKTGKIHKKRTNNQT